MDEAQAKDRLIEEMKENEKLRAQVEELKAERDQYKQRASDLKFALGSDAIVWFDRFNATRTLLRKVIPYLTLPSSAEREETAEYLELLHRECAKMAETVYASEAQEKNA